MSLTTRLLPSEEWPKLEGTEAETVWPHLTPDAKVMVVEDDGAIVGCWLLLPTWHAECVWVHPDRRTKGSVARRLWHYMHTMARAMGLKAVVTSATDDHVRHLLVRHGAMELSGTHYVIPVRTQGD